MEADKKNKQNKVVQENNTKNLYSSAVCLFSIVEVKLAGLESKVVTESSFLFSVNTNKLNTIEKMELTMNPMKLIQRIQDHL